MEMGFHRSAGNSGDAGIYGYWRRNCAAPVELAAARAFWLAPDRLLASAWTSCALPDSLRRVWVPRAAALRWPMARKGTLRPHDAGRERTVPGAHARNLRRRPNHGREQGAIRREATGKTWPGQSAAIDHAPARSNRIGADSAADRSSMVPCLYAPVASAPCRSNHRLGY